MGDPRSLLPHEVEIFVVRELRKAGLEPSAVKVRERTSSKSGADYVVELSCVLRIGDADDAVLVACRNEPAPVTAAIIDVLHTSLPKLGMKHGMVFSTSGFEPNAIRTARTLGIPVLAVADGKTAFARSPWGMAGDPPAWVPEYMAELIDIGVTGNPRHELLAAGGAKRILDCFAATSAES